MTALEIMALVLFVVVFLACEAPDGHGHAPPRKREGDHRPPSLSGDR